MNTAFLIKRFEKNLTKEAIVWRGNTYSYEWLLKETYRWIEYLKNKIPLGAVVELNTDFSPKSVAIFLALLELDSVIVPMTNTLKDKKNEFREIAEIEYGVAVDSQENVSIQKYTRIPQHPILITLKQKKHPGLILFSSGSTGISKAVVHDLIPLLKKFEAPRHSKRMIAFLLFDHIGGINTLFYSLYNGGCIIVLEERLPHIVCAAIEKHRAEILPTSPTFLNLLIMSEAWGSYDLSSLEWISYGTEIMSEETLRRISTILPHVKLQQTYGLSELGILRSKSESPHSLFMKIGGEGFNIRVVDGLLEVKAESAMLGYLNAPSPFTEDGWFKTGDAVEVKGEFVKILGRKSEIINVGGEKVYPAHIENILQNIPGVEEVVVYGEPHFISGAIVVAIFKLSQEEAMSDFKQKMHAFCKDKLLRYQIPQKIKIVSHTLHGERFKKMRNFNS